MFENITNAAKRQEVTTEYNKVMGEFKNTQIFPNGNLPNGFLDIIRKCLSFHSPTSLQMTSEKFMNIIGRHDLSFCYLDMGTIIYCMQNRSQAEMGMSIKEYHDFLDLTDLIVLEWTTLMTNHANEVGKQMEEKALAEILMEETKQRLFDEAIENGKKELQSDLHMTIPLGQAAEA